MRLLRITKGKVIGRDRKENYDKLPNLFFLRSFINVREIKTV
jgi:hypothetical protein